MSEHYLLKPLPRSQPLDPEMKKPAGKAGDSKTTKETTQEQCSTQAGQNNSSAPVPDLSEARRLFDAGFKLCKLVPNTKQPAGDGWNTRPITAFDEKATGYGVVLKANGICSVDPDNAPLAEKIVAAWGFDLETIMDTGVRSVSTRPGSGGRSAFRAVEGLKWIKFAFYDAGTVLELRAASDNLQDVIPGLVYADKTGELRTQSYFNCKRLDKAPDLPADFLAFWQRMSTDIEFLRRHQQIAGDVIGLRPMRSISAGGKLAFESPHRVEFNKAHKVEDLLPPDLYEPKGRRWKYLHGEGQPGVRPIQGKDDLWQSDHASDPLSGTFDAWIVFVLYHHAENVEAAEAAWSSQRGAKLLGEVTPIVDDDVPALDGECFDVFAHFKDLTLNDEDVKKMSDAEFLIPNMIVRGHMAAYVSPGNGGKTTIFIYLCEKLATMGLQVLYINVDGSPGDLKRHHAHAAAHGYVVISPDAKDGKSTNDALNKLRGIAASAARCDKVVFILDTLKKFVDVIDKRKAKELFNLMRALTVKGATVCLLGHTNKHAGEDGKQIYEGTGDLRNDLDELIYLDAFKNEANNTLEVTTRPDKVRAEFSPKSYIIKLDDRTVTEPENVIKVLSKDAREMLNLIGEAITQGAHSQKEIVEWVKPRTIHGDKKIRGMLANFTHSTPPGILCVATGRGKDLHYSLPVMASAISPIEDDDLLGMAFTEAPKNNDLDLRRKAVFSRMSENLHTFSNTFISPDDLDKIAKQHRIDMKQLAAECFIAMPEGQRLFVPIGA